MEPSPWYRDRDLPLDYYLILPHASEARVLLVRDGHAWTLPRFTPDVTDFRRVHHINNHAKELYGFDAAVQRCVAHRYDRDRRQQYRVYALENLSPAPHLPAGGQWVNGTELDRMEVAIPEHRELIRRWLQEAETQAVPELRSPWSRTGWFAEASGWI